MIPVVSVIFAFPEHHGAAQSLSEFKEFLSQRPKPLKIRFFKYYPEAPDFPIYYYDVHFQQDGYLIKYHECGKKGGPAWHSTTNWNMLGKAGSFYWSLDGNSLDHFDMATIPTKYIRNSVSSEHDSTGLYELYDVLNLGLTYAPLWRLQFDGPTFAVTNAFPSAGRPAASECTRALSGKFLVSGEEEIVTGVDMDVYYWASKETAEPRKFHWVIDYSYERDPFASPVIPSVINYGLVKLDGKEKQLNRINIERFEFCSSVHSSAFMPKNVLTNGLELLSIRNINADGELTLTNSHGVVQTVEEYSEEWDKWWNRRQSASKLSKLFPVIFGAFLCFAVFLFLRGDRSKKHKSTNEPKAGT